jgi:transposase-like protein
MDSHNAPEPPLEAIQFFSNPDRALTFMIGMRWPDGNVTCPTCGSEKVSFVATRRVWACKENHPRKQFSIKVGTVMEDSPIGLDKWLPAFWLIANCKNGISSYELGRNLNVTQKSAWFMLHRIRLAMQTGTFSKMSGEVEADETFVGGRARFMHPGRRKRIIKSRGPSGKAAVMGLLERHGPDGHSTVRAKVVDDNKRRTLHPEIKTNVETGSKLFTDEVRSYDGLEADYVHAVINHAECYAIGNVHTNGLENFWSLLKRAIKGTYVSVEPFHLFRYLDEKAFRFNARKGHDGKRFGQVIRNIVGKRLIYKTLIGDELIPATT